MGAQPDTSTSAPEVWHGVLQILAPIFVARLLATHLDDTAYKQSEKRTYPVRMAYPTPSRLWVLCPFCNKVHQHGRHPAGHRHAHCLLISLGSYILVETNDPPPPEIEAAIKA